MRSVRWDTAEAMRRRAPHQVENLALVPANLLPYKATYQRLANQLPAGTVLIVLPTDQTPEQQTLQTAATRLRAKGHPVVTLTADEVLDRRGRPALTPAPSGTASIPPAVQPADDHTSIRTAEPPHDSAVSSSIEVPPFTREMRLVSIDATRNRARFYVLQWQPTLWGSVALLRVWGRIGTPGQARVLFEAPAPQSTPALTRVVRQRLRHGYRVADWH